MDARRTDTRTSLVPYPFLTYNPFNIRAAIYIGASLFAAVAFVVMNALHW